MSSQKGATLLCSTVRLADLSVLTAAYMIRVHIRQHTHARIPYPCPTCKRPPPSRLISAARVTCQSPSSQMKPCGTWVSQHEHAMDCSHLWIMSSSTASQSQPTSTAYLCMNVLHLKNPLQLQHSNPAITPLSLVSHYPPTI